MSRLQVVHGGDTDRDTTHDPPWDHFGYQCHTGSTPKPVRMFVWVGLHLL